MAAYPNNHRKRADVIKLIKNNFEVNMLNQNNLNEFTVKFKGPPKTPYESGEWLVRVYLPDNYPFGSPNIAFVNRIYHPNIDPASGAICLDVINQRWTALYDLNIIFETFLPQLLTYPNASDPLNADAALMMDLKPEKYKYRVLQYVQKFASKGVNSGKTPDSVEAASSTTNSQELPQIEIPEKVVDVNSDVSSLSSMSDEDDD